MKRAFFIFIEISVAKNCLRLESAPSDINLCGEEHQYTGNSFLFFLKNSRYKQPKKPININYLIIMLIKMRLFWGQPRNFEKGWRPTSATMAG